MMSKPKGFGKTWREVNFSRELLSAGKGQDIESARKSEY
jgi:hypothetical protein